MLNKLMSDMERMKDENDKLRKTVELLESKSTAPDSGQSKNEDESLDKSENENGDKGYTFVPKLEEQLKAARAESSLLDGMPALHGIGSVELPIAEEAVFEKWYRRTEKSLTGSRVKVFNGTGWVTWKQMFLREVALNQLQEILRVEKKEDEVMALEPYHRKKYVISDILLCAFIEARVNERAGNRIAACPTAFLKWHKLEEVYAKTSLAAQNGLTEKWNGLKQVGSQTIEQYVERIDFLAMEMAAAGIPPTGQAKLYALVSGASADWSTEIKVLKTQRATYEQSCEVLLEAGIEKESAKASSLEKGMAASAYARGSGERGGYRGGYQGQGRGREGPQICMVCGTQGHMHWQCPTGLRTTYVEGKPVPRCFNCLGEGHRSPDCPDPVRRVRGSFKREDVVAGRVPKPLGDGAPRGGAGNQA
jgi:hypothetical protein